MSFHSFWGSRIQKGLSCMVLSQGVSWSCRQDVSWNCSTWRLDWGWRINFWNDSLKWMLTIPLHMDLSTWLLTRYDMTSPEQVIHKRAARKPWYLFGPRLISYKVWLCHILFIQSKPHKFSSHTRGGELGSTSCQRTGGHIFSTPTPREAYM